MLSKLIKYEIKATGRLFLPFFLSLLVFAVITKLISNPQDWSFPAVISMAIYVFIMAGMFIMTLIVIIQRFQRNLLSDEGYLMFTLPVKTWKQIVSKLLVSILWIAASLTVAFFSIMIIVYQKGMLNKISQPLADLFGWLHKMFGTSLYLLTFEMILSALTTLIAGIMVIYASLAIGHLFSQHKILASLGAFVALNTLSQFLFMLSNLLLPDYFIGNTHISTLDPDSIIMFGELIIFYGILFTGLLSAAYFAVTNYILSKKLNLD